MDVQPVATPGDGAEARGVQEWRHAHIRLKIGKNFYPFRTLSLLDAASIEPLILPLMQVLSAGDRPLEYARIIYKILNIISPALLQQPDDLAALSKTQVQALWEFYAEQDWGRLKAIRAIAPPEDPAASGDAGEFTARTTFYMMCAAGAKQSNCSVMEFMDSRFEHAVDVLLALHEQWAKNEAERPKPQDLFNFMASNMQPETYDPENAPSWMKDVDSLKD